VGETVEVKDERRTVDVTGLDRTFVGAATAAVVDG